jgi:hypothetical protein
MLVQGQFLPAQVVKLHNGLQGSVWPSAISSQAILGYAGGLHVGNTNEQRVRVAGCPHWQQAHVPLLCPTSTTLNKIV